MEAYDLVMLAVVVGATIWGAWKGLAWQIASLASIVVSYMVALRFRGPVAEMIRAEAPWNRFLAMLLLFMGTSLLIWIGFRFFASVIERFKLKEFDRQFGAALGLAKGVVLCVIITLFAVTLLGEEQRQSIIHSRSGLYISRLLDRSHAVLPDELHDLLHPYIQALDERLGNERIQGQEGGRRDGDPVPASIPAEQRIKKEVERRVNEELWRRVDPRKP